MSDNDIPTSGSRWEPAGDDAGRTPTPPEGTPVPPAEHDAGAAEDASTPGYEPAEAAHPTPAAEPGRATGRRRGRVALAAAGAGLVLAGGFGGFALGHALAGDGTEVSDSGAVTDADQDGVPDGARDGGRGGRAGLRPATARGPPDGRPCRTTGEPRRAGRRRRYRVSVMTAPHRAAGPAAGRPTGAPASRGRRGPHRAVALLWSSLLLVTYWWVAGGGVQDLAAWDTGLTSTGRLTGLLASDLLLVQVLLMARVPVLERAFGQDRLARHHRVVGFTSFNLLLGHLVLITWGYAAGRLSATPATLWELTVDYPGMLLAVAGTVCLVMVVVTSVRAARRRLRYESWHLLHLYGYLGAGLALPHQLWTGQEFLVSPAATVFWWGLWATSAGAVLVWRVGLPLWRSARHRVRVTSVVPEGHGVVSVYMTGRRMEKLRAEAGQFFTWRFLTGPGWTRGHPYSLSAAPDGVSLRITVKELGDDSAVLRHVRPGTRVLVEGPYGRLSARARTRSQGRPHRRRRRHHPAPGAGRGAGLRARRRRPALPVQRPAAVRRGDHRARPGAGPRGRLAARPATGAPLVARRRRRRGRRPHRADLLGARHRRARRLRLRAGELGRGRPCHHPRGRPPRRPLPRRAIRMVS